jgi:hypothetical protein
MGKFKVLTKAEAANIAPSQCRIGLTTEEAKKWRWIPEGTKHYAYDRFELVAYPSIWKENGVSPRRDHQAVPARIAVISNQ